MGSKTHSERTTAPMVSAAGKDHVIFSKKLLLSIAVVLIVTAFLFFTVEQSRIAGNIAKSKKALEQNAAVKAANEKLEEAKTDLQAEEDELVNLYSQWLDEDSSELELSQEQLAQLKDKLKTVTERISDHSSMLEAKSSTLQEKEERLSAYQFKIQQKQAYIEQLADVLVKLNSTAPRKGVAIDEEVDDLIWDDEFEADDDFAYSEFYAGDDDWLDDGTEW